MDFSWDLGKSSSTPIPAYDELLCVWEYANSDRWEEAPREKTCSKWGLPETKYSKLQIQLWLSQRSSASANSKRKVSVAKKDLVCEAGYLGWWNAERHLSFENRYTGLAAGGDSEQQPLEIELRNFRNRRGEPLDSYLWWQNFGLWWPEWRVSL